MKKHSRTIVLSVAVAALGVGLVVQYAPILFPESPPKRVTKSVKRKPPVVDDTPVSSTADDAIEQQANDPLPAVTEPPSTAPAIAATAPGSDVPPTLEIPDLTNQLAEEKKSDEPDPRQVGGFRGEIFMRLDSNGDLRLERLEIPEFCREQMMALDANNDGKINFTEFDSAIAKLPPPPPSRTTIATSALVNPPEPGQEIPTYEPQINKRNSDAPMWFLQLDKSKDGHIAIYEWPPGRLMEFRALDLNNDGFITLEEAKKAEAIKQTAKTELPDSATDRNDDRASSP